MNQPKHTQFKSTNNLKLNYILGEMILKALSVSTYTLPTSQTNYSMGAKVEKLTFSFTDKYKMFH